MEKSYNQTLTPTKHTEAMEKMKMSLLEAWYRRNFCSCIDLYSNHFLRIGDVHYEFKTQKVRHIYVGKNTLWIQKYK